MKIVYDFELEEWIKVDENGAQIEPTWSVSMTPDYGSGCSNTDLEFDDEGDFWRWYQAEDPR